MTDNSAPGSARPLSGVRVLDLTHAIIGALAARLLADFGADVVKVENPDGGDFYRMRQGRPADSGWSDSPRWLGLNYNKRSLALDLSADDGRAVLGRLAMGADVLIHNFRPPVARRLGVDSASVLAMNPRIVHCSLSGYGETGPYASRRSGDPYAQAISGAVAASGSPGQPPVLGTTTWVDHGGSALAAFGVLLGLQERARTGKGCAVDTNLLDTAFFFQSSSSLMDFLLGASELVKGGRGASGAFPWGGFAAADGDVVTFHGGTDPEWPHFCAAVGRPELADDPRFASAASRTAHREDLYAELDQVFRSASRAEWVERFRNAGTRCDPALTYAEAIADPQVEHNQIITDDENGFRTVANPLHIDGQRPGVRKLPPDIGEDSRSVLTEAGYSEIEVQDLIDTGIVRSGDVTKVS